MPYTTDDTELLAAIRDDILARPEFYRDGETYLRTRYGPDRLHQEAVADWQRFKDHPTQKASHRAIAEDMTNGIADPAERETRFREILDNLSAAPKRERWSPAACFCRVIQDMLSKDWDVDGYTVEETQARAKAVCIAAVLLRFKYADELHPMFGLFGPWGATRDGVSEHGRWAATFFLKQNDGKPLRHWMKCVREAWMALAKPASPGPAAALSAKAPASANPGKTYSVGVVLDMAAVSNTTLNHYAKLAGIRTPGRGKRNHRYNADEVRQILRAIIDSTGDRAVKDRCRHALAKL